MLVSTVQHLTVKYHFENNPQLVCDKKKIKLEFIVIFFVPKYS